MRIIGKTEEMPYKKTRIRLFDEEQQLIGVFYRTTLYRCNIKEGSELTESLMQRLIETETPQVFERTIRLLGQKAYSEKELLSYYQRQQYDEKVIAETMQRLMKLDLINDKDLSKDQAEMLLGRGYSRNAVRNKLLQRGIDAETAQQAMESCSEEKEKENALRTAETLFHKYRSEDEKKRIYKVSAAMARKGFSWEKIRWAVGQVTDWDLSEIETE